MHMADALISPEVGGVLWVVSAATAVYAAKRVAKAKDSKIIPLMGVAGAFIFAAQMLNFSIPLTGSSGHIGGALLLAILIGPYAAFLAMWSILFVQCLFFGDGGLLALGCNVFNMGFIPLFIVFPFIYKPLISKFPKFRFLITVVCAVIGMQIGAFGVVTETMISGISSLPFTKFVLLMQPIHLAIGLVEGVATAFVLEFVYKAAPDFIKGTVPSSKHVLVKVVVTFAILAVICGGLISYLASKNPDGLEWSVGKTTGSTELNAPKTKVFSTISNIQSKISFLEGYSFDKEKSLSSKLGNVSGGLAGIVGVVIVLCLAGATGFFLIRRSKDEDSADNKS